MNFLMIDLGFLIGFSLFVIIFLYSRRKNLKREGVLFLYRTQWGVRLIEYVGRKYKRTLKFFSYISIGLGYILMATILFLVGKVVYIYVRSPEIVKAIKIPPIMPLIPYLPQLFKIDFLPPFYFTYWIVIIALIAIPHEFAHGIFSRYIGVKVKSTGFGFLGPFLAAFVEPDEKEMNKKSIFKQLSVLSSGTFANVLTALFFLMVLVLFFKMCFVPAGIIFDTYAYSVVDISQISSINGVNLSNLSYEGMLNLMKEEGFNEIRTKEEDFIATKKIIEEQKENKGYLLLYYDAPAINAGLVGAITTINEVKVNNIEQFGEELKKYSSGETINITTKTENETKNYEIILGKNPQEDISWLGIGFSQVDDERIIGKIYSGISKFKEEHIYYEAKSPLAIFINDLLWWVILISINVALINMLPVGIFDGGRVFYLTCLYFLKDEKKTKKIFSWTTYVFLFLLLVIMISWAFSIF